MRQTIQTIRETLAGHFPASEIEGFVAIILESVGQLSRTDLIVRPELRLNDQTKKKIDSIIDRLLQNEPIQYILGQADFFGLKFHVDHRVLIPRGETEELVDQIIRHHRHDRPVILDIGTGSGCIAIALKKNLPQSTVWACDISPLALEVARQNASDNHTGINFIAFDVLNGQPETDLPAFDSIVSNPPYVTEAEKEVMPHNVLFHEPGLALFVPDNDPLCFYRAIGLFALKNLKPEGRLFFEINEAFGAETAQLLSDQGFDHVRLMNDLHGKHRMVTATKPAL